jgi:hypothetical protein
MFRESKAWKVTVCSLNCYLEDFMGKRIKASLLSAVVSCLLILTAQSNLSFAGSATADSELTPEKLIAEHIKSIGGPSILSSVQTRAFVGSTDVEFIQGMMGSIKNGTSMFVSDGKKLGIVLKYGSVDYPEEYFSYNGNEVSVGHISPGQRSPLADFFYRFSGIVKEGFIGGTLSLSWPSLLDNPEIQAKLKYKKTKVEGRELNELEWPISILGNVRIRMFFEPGTFRHVRTEYHIRIKEDVSVQNSDTYLGEMATSEDGSGRSNLLRKDLIPDSIYALIETFDDYKKVSGMTLPHKYTLEYSLEGQGHSFIGKWTINARKWIFNRTFDEKIFKAQK